MSFSLTDLLTKIEKGLEMRSLIETEQLPKTVNATFIIVGEFCYTAALKTEMSRRQLQKNPCKKEHNYSFPGNKRKNLF